ncbi:MAG: DUF502 domain-containing protein [Candidatus Aminicenantales bacterium]
MRKIFKHIRIYIFRGLLAVIPLALTFLVVRFLYLAVDQKVAGLIEGFIGFRIPGLGLLLVLIILYLLGLAASNWAGKRIFSLIERATKRIPLIKTIYQLGLKLGTALSMPEKQAFKKAVMVEHFRPGIWSIGFVTGAVTDRKKDGETLLKLFIPTAPNPTSGFMIIVRESQVRELGWSITEAMNAIISGGIIGPKEIE